MASNDILVTLRFSQCGPTYLRLDPGFLLCQLLPSGSQMFTSRGSHSLSLVFWIQDYFTTSTLPLLCIIPFIPCTCLRCHFFQEVPSPHTEILPARALASPTASHAFCDPLFSSCPSSLQIMNTSRAGGSIVIKSPPVPGQQ